TSIPNYSCALFLASMYALTQLGWVFIFFHNLAALGEISRVIDAPLIILVGLYLIQQLYPVCRRGLLHFGFWVDDMGGAENSGLEHCTCLGSCDWDAQSSVNMVPASF